MYWVMSPVLVVKQREKKIISFKIYTYVLFGSILLQVWYMFIVKYTCMLLQVKGLYKTCMCVDLLPPPDSYMLKQDGTPSVIILVRVEILSQDLSL